jgi:hypothetical protein
MTDHKIEPRRQGRYVTCKVCGYEVIYYRVGNRAVRGGQWRHKSYAQSAGHLALINPNWRP